jgi:hypothetical protein
MIQQLTVAVSTGLPDFCVLGFLGREGGERQGVNRAGELLGQEAIDAALAGDAAFPSKSGRNDLDAEMRLTFGTRTDMAGVAVRLVMNDEPERLEAGGELGTDTLGNGHRVGTVKAERAPVKPRPQGSLVALVTSTPSPHT